MPMMSGSTGCHLVQCHRCPHSPRIDTKPNILEAEAKGTPSSSRSRSRIPSCYRRLPNNTVGAVSHFAPFTSSYILEACRASRSPEISMSKQPSHAFRPKSTTIRHTSPTSACMNSSVSLECRRLFLCNCPLQLQP